MSPKLMSLPVIRKKLGRSTIQRNEGEVARKIASGVTMRARFERFEYLFEQARSILQAPGSP